MTTHRSCRRDALAWIVLLLLCLPGLAKASTIPVKEARVVEVTVYPDRAEVVREARVDLPAGTSTVELTAVPWQVEPNSLRVSAKGIAAVLGAVELKEIAEEPKESPDYVAARDEADRIQSEIEILRAGAATAKEMRDFLTSLRASKAQRESEKLGEGRADPNSIAAVFSMIRTQLGVLDVEALSRNERMKKLDEQARLAKAKLDAARPPASIHSRTATVEVETKQAGALTIRLGYVSPGALWFPTYRASLDAATGDVALVSEAIVRQSSGEDWSGVTLRLSTAAPSRGVAPPVLTSVLLRPMEKLTAEQIQRLPVVGHNYQNILTLSPGVTDTEGDHSAASGGFVAVNEIQSTSQESSLVHSDYNVTFEVPGRSDVPADGRDHRVGLRQETLHGKVEYHTVPGLQPAAFLVAKSEAPADYPLLSGSVRVFTGGAYLGTFNLAETAPKGELTLPFGVDNRIAVDRKPLPQERSQEGVISKDWRLAYAFQTTVENLRDQKVTVVLEDGVPVSEDERIEVQQGKGTTPGFTVAKGRPGILLWNLDLAPREKKEIVLEYSVRYPRDLIVPGF